MAFIRKDHFHKKAKQEGFRSRAAYKLQELHKRFRLFRQGGKVLDLGAAPGGWMQISAQLVGKHGKVVGIDRFDIHPLPNAQVSFLQGDLLDPSTQEKALSLMEGKANCVLSDMSPDLSGVRFTDCVRSFELASLSLNIARKCLQTDGAFVVKIFPGEDFEPFLREMRSSFKNVRTTRPEATRKSSSEVYVIGTQFRLPKS